MSSTSSIKEKIDQYNATLQEIKNKYSSFDLIVGVTSVKGGVGKSTITSMLAAAFAEQGKKVGILDIDITGSSIPSLMGVHGPAMVEDNLIIPPTSHKGIKVMGMALITGAAEKAVLWRGPLVSKAVLEMAQMTDFSDRDVIVVDFPPGTSDVPITAYQAIPLSGIVLVTTPQILAMDIVKKAHYMSDLLNVKIFGVIENMAWYECPKCGYRSWPFGKREHGEIESELGAPVLAEIPINEEISKKGDEGKIEDIGGKYLGEVASELLKLHKKNPK